MLKLHNGESVTELEGVFHSNAKEFWECNWWLVFNGEGEILLFGVDFDPLDVSSETEIRLGEVVASLEEFYQGSSFHEIRQGTGNERRK